MYTNEPLYIFVHIPKTAGSTFGRHLEENFNEEELLPVYYGREYYNLVTGGYEQFQSREDIEAYLRSLSTQQKGSLRVVYGHEVYYGMREYFDREVRFVTFLRHPEGRVVSAYNHRRRFQEIAPGEPAWETNAHFRWYWSGVRKDMHKDGVPIPFTEWVRERSAPSYPYTFLFKRGLLDVAPDDLPGADPDSVFGKFYFVGTTEYFNDESLFLFHELGISKFYSDQNVSKKYIAALDADVTQLVRNVHCTEYVLYEAACAWASAFKRRHRMYASRIRFMRLKRWCNIKRRAAILNPVRALFILSAFLKQRSDSYAAVVERVKHMV